VLIKQEDVLLLLGTIFLAVEKDTLVAAAGEKMKLK